MEEIKITLSLGEYFDLYKGRPFKFITIDKRRKDEIERNPKWSEFVYIEQINESNDDCFKLWKLEDWMHECQVKVDEIKKDKKHDFNILSEERHKVVEAWKTETRQKLRKLASAGKIKFEKIETYIQKALDPNPENEFEMNLSRKLKAPQYFWRTSEKQSWTNK